MGTAIAYDDNILEWKGDDLCGNSPLTRYSTLKIDRPSRKKTDSGTITSLEDLDLGHDAQFPLRRPRTDAEEAAKVEKAGQWQQTQVDLITSNSPTDQNPSASVGGSIPPVEQAGDSS